MAAEVKGKIKRNKILFKNKRKIERNWKGD